tara:strand:+ start:177 stop:788 length:612 start_codon:yes stop_codon:yes gene_type:complete
MEKSEEIVVDLNNNKVTYPIWEQSDNLSNLIIVPLDETEYKLKHENYIEVNSEETRGISKKVIVEYKNVTRIRYKFFPELRMGNFSSTTDWNIFSNLSVNYSTHGVSYFHIMNKRVPFTQTIFKKNTLNDSPFPSMCVQWHSEKQMPEVHVELNEPGDVTISYDKIYTPCDLGRKIITNKEFLIPLEGFTLHAMCGYVGFKDE